MLMAFTVCQRVLKVGVEPWSLGIRPCMGVGWVHRVPVRVSILLVLSYQGDGLSVEIWGSGN
jgi:hypothetical protein